MPVTVLYRLSSGEVEKISIKGQQFPDRDQNYWGVLTDPSFPNGTELRSELLNGDLGPLREFGLAKIWDGSAVRDATQVEIDGFQAPNVDDDAKQDAAGTIDLLKTHPRWRKFGSLIFKMINKTRVDAGLAPFTRQQIALFVDAQVSKDD